MSFGGIPPNCFETKKRAFTFATGVTASEKIAERDLKNLQKYETKIKNVGKKLGVDPALIAAIISRESHGGIVLKDGWGDGGNGFGLMQVFISKLKNCSHLFCVRKNHKKL